MRVVPCVRAELGALRLPQAGLSILPCTLKINVQLHIPQSGEPLEN